MSLQDLQAVLQQQVDGHGAIEVSGATLQQAKLTPAPNFDTIVQTGLDLAGPLSVTFTGKIPDPTGTTLSLSGTASFLGQSAIGVGLVFTLETDATVDLLLTATLPAAWNFNKSFPLLVGFPFAELALTDASYLLTTKQTSYTWQQQSLTLNQGLNLAASLGLGGPLAILQTLISSLTKDATATLVGTINPAGITNLATGTPAIALTGTINAPITADTHFDLSVPQVLLTSQPDENGHLAYWLSFSSTLSVSSQPFSIFQASIPQGSSNLSFYMLPTKNPITPAEIIGLLAGVDYRQYIPPAMESVFEAVSLTGLTASIDTKTMNVLALSGNIGTTAPWPMGQFTIEGLTLGCQVLLPFPSPQAVLVTFSATATIFPNIFAGEFVFEISYDLVSKDLTIAANYLGTVDINKLVAGLSDNAIQIPSNFAALEFDDFGMTFTEAGSVYNYTLYGSAKGTFNITILDSPIVATFEINVDSATSTYTLIGGLTLADSFFMAEANLSGGKQVLTGSWQALNADYLSFQDILGALSLPVPDIPSKLDLALESASITYNITDSIFAISAQSANYGSAVFVSLPIAGKQQFFFLLGIDSSFSLSNLPLVGKELASIENIQVGQLQVIIGSDIASPDTAAQINGVIATLPGSGYPTMPTTGTTGTLILMAELDFGTQKLPLNLSLGGTSSSSTTKALTDGAGATSTALVATSTPTNGAPVNTSTSGGGVTWFTVQRSFGPVTIQRIGALYQSDQQTLWFELDATLAFGPMQISLVGLGIGSSIADFAPKFSLQGLGISYSEPPVEIAGTLVNLAPPGADYIEFEGGVTIGTGEFTLMAFGYYGNKQSFSSLFLFGVLAYDFGGPPAFFVTGVALGFGYNSSLLLPTIDQVQAFPFVQVLPTSMVPNTGVFPSEQPLTVLNVIMNTKPPWVAPSAGSLWFAAGITFTSFELVNSQALVIVEVGPELVISLIGTSRAQFPQPTGVANEPVYAYIELDLLVRFAPTEGVFSVQAVLAKSSFVLDRACVLTGGFAFFVWFGDNPHAGDFVLTLGGYNPGFTPPAHYPQVPRVGFHWSLDSSITISGGAYFALTPSVLMVGGELNATYQSGNLKAWFDAHADVIVQWKPFWIDAGIGITIGASYKVDLLFTSFTVSIELGCDLEVWGPPTGGTVTVDWYIIKFTIPFGSSKSSAPKIQGWNDVQAMLPNTGTESTPNVLSLAPAAGLSPNTTSPSGSNSNTPAATADAATPAPWIVRGSTFGFSTSSPIPATTATVGRSYTFNGSTFNVAPLGWNGVSATHAVTITDANNKDVSAAFSAVQVQRNVPSSLWGAPPAQTPSSDQQVVPNQIVGVTVNVNPPLIGSTAGPVNVAANLEATPLNLPGATLPISSSAQPSGDLAANSQQTISLIADPQKGIAAGDTVSARNAIFAALQTLGYAPATTNDPMTNFANEIGCALAAEPLLVPTGD